MKAYLIALFALSSGIASGQAPASNPPKTGTLVARVEQRSSRIRQPTPPPAGFWVVEENVGEQAIVHFYTDSRQEFCADTLRQKRLNLKSRAVVVRLNKRLTSLLAAQSAPASVAVLRP